MRWAFLLAAAGFAVVLLTPQRLSAQPVRTRILSGMSLKQDEISWQIRVLFNLPVQYVRHAPQREGDQLQIQLRPLAISPQDAPLLGRRESLNIPSDFPVPLEELTYEGDAPGGPFLVLDFEREVQFRVSQGDDFRSLVVAVRKPTRIPRIGDVPAIPEVRRGDRVARIMTEGRRAMTAGEYDRAVALFTKIRSLPRNAFSRDALELLALARERKGQLAHARAEYEQYLQLYPDGEGARRVGQRLDALITADAAPLEKLRKPAKEKRAVDYRGYGSLSLSYSREEQVTDVEGDPVTDHSQISHLNATGRVSTDRVLVEGRYAGSYRLDLLRDQRADDARITTLTLEARDLIRDLGGIVGRQSRSSGGVLGRFDGLLLDWQFAERFGVTAVGGFPLESSRATSIETDHQLAGLTLSAGRFFDSIDGEIFGVGQFIDGLTERVAVGGELRYSQHDRYALAFLDYDVYFQNLNTVLLTGNWIIDRRSDVHFQADYRSSPILLLTNAISGQGVRSVDALRDIYTTGQIEDLARDRSADSYSANLGGSHYLIDDLQLAGDFTVSYLSGTSDSLAVDPLLTVFGTESTSVEYNYALQLIKTSLFVEHDLNSIGVRVFDGGVSDVYTVTLSGRYPLARKIRLNPNLRVDFRDRRPSPNDTLTVRPWLRFDARWRSFVFDTEVGLEWVKDFGPPSSETDLGYFVFVSFRYDF